MTNQVLSISQMEELVRLGIDTSKASMFWHPAFYRVNGILDYDRYGDIPTIKLENNYNLKYDIPTFTLQDILEILPKPCYINCIDEDFYQCEVTTNNGSLSTNSKTAIASAFNMLKLCKQNGNI